MCLPGGGICGTEEKIWPNCPNCRRTDSAFFIYRQFNLEVHMQGNNSSGKDRKLEAVCVCDNLPYFVSISQCTETAIVMNTKTISREWEHHDQRKIELIIPLADDVLTLLADVNRISKTDDSHYAVDITLLNPPQGYLDYLAAIR